MRKKLTISIINYRTADLTIQAVTSVLDDMRGIDGRVVIVDNGSGDGSLKALEAWIATLPEDAPVTLVASADNTGFSGGHNQGMAACPAEYYLIQNSDTLLRRGFLRTILDAADATPDAGLLAPRIEHEDGVVQDSCFRFHSATSEFVRAIRTGFVSRLLSGRVTSLGPDPDPDQIEWASFASILLRGQMVDALGAMDEGYFLYFEDAEYCLRARRAGWKIVYVPQAIAVHFRGGSGPVKARLKTRAALPAYYYRSRARFLFQAHGRMGLLGANLGWHAGRIIKNASRILGQKIYPMPQHEGRNIWLNFTAPLTPDAPPIRISKGDVDE
jgi:N-acetylglucosaminyl-diphospho-decaprenol L-rhamnosyltransferase